MKLTAIFASWLCIVCFTAETLGHGNPIEVEPVNGQLTVANGLTLAEGFARLASDPHEDAAFDFAPNQKLRSVYPGYDIAGFATDAPLQLEIIPRPDYTAERNPLRWLWYWSSASQSVADVPNDATFNAVSIFASGMVQVRQSELVAGPTLTIADSAVSFLGADQHLLVYELQDYSPSQTGAYGVFAELSSPGLVSSEPFLLLFRYGVAPEMFEVAAQAINAAAVDPLPGDFNRDGTVNAADYTVWRDGLPTGDFQPNDYQIWKEHFGQTIINPPQTDGALTAPEPRAAWLAIGAAWGVPTRCARRRVAVSH